MPRSRKHGAFLFLSPLMTVSNFFTGFHKLLQSLSLIRMSLRSAIGGTKLRRPKEMACPDPSGPVEGSPRIHIIGTGCQGQRDHFFDFRCHGIRFFFCFRSSKRGHSPNSPLFVWNNHREFLSYLPSIISQKAHVCDIILMLSYGGDFS